LSSDSHIKSKAIFKLVPGQDFQAVQWTVENWEIAKQQFEALFGKVEAILQKY
jgi:hypothetical protein